jgi:hypothetical protein
MAGGMTAGMPPFPGMPMMPSIAPGVGPQGNLNQADFIAKKKEFLREK